MTRQLYITFALTLLGLLLACSSVSAQTLKVITTLPDLAAITHEIGGDRVQIQAIVRPTEDPHYVDARPSMAVRLNKADLLILNGMELEIGWLPPLLVQSRNPNIQPGGLGYLDASAAITAMEIPASVDRSQGDVHGQGNPHYLTDARRAVPVAKLITTRLSQLDPAGAEAYQKNLSRFTAELETLIKEETDRFAALPVERRQVITFHRSQVYLLNWLGLRRDLSIEPKPGIQPTPSHTAKVLQKIKGQRVPAILQEDYYPRKTSQTLARLGKTKLVIFDGGTHFTEGERYTTHIRKVTGAIYEAIAP